jgi:hypothetical protein
VAVEWRSGEVVFWESVGFELRKKSPMTRMRASDSERCDASLCMCKYISLALDRMVAFGCIAAYFRGFVMVCVVASVKLDWADVIVPSATSMVGSIARP